MFIPTHAPYANQDRTMHFLQNRNTRADALFPTTPRSSVFAIIHKTLMD